MYSHKTDDSFAEEMKDYYPRKKTRSNGQVWKGYQPTCEELCGRVKPCGNTYCSNNPRFRGRNRKKRK